MNERHRSWLLGCAAGGLTLLVTASAAGWYALEHAVRRSPQVVIDWSPFPDQVLRAACAIMAANPAGFEINDMAHLIRSLSIKRMAGLVGQRETYAAHRALWFAGMIALTRPVDTRTLEAQELVKTWVHDPRAWIRSGVFEIVGLNNVEQISLLRPMLEDDHPYVAYIAIQSLRGLDSPPEDPDLVECLCRLLDSRHAVSNSATTRNIDHYNIPKGVDAPQLRPGLFATGAMPPVRVLTLGEIEWLDSNIKSDAWNILAVFAPSRFIEEINRRRQSATTSDLLMWINASKFADRAPLDLFREIADSQENYLVWSVFEVLKIRMAGFRRWRNICEVNRIDLDSYSLLAALARNDGYIQSARETMTWVSKAVPEKVLQAVLDQMDAADRSQLQGLLETIKE